MPKYNAFYSNCTHLQWRYPKSTYIGNSHSRVIAWCKYFKVNVYSIKRNDDIEMCCVSQSPYISQNCKMFKNKNNQTQLEEFL